MYCSHVKNVVNFQQCIGSVWWPFTSAPDRPFPYRVIRCWVRTRPLCAVWVLSCLFKPTFWRLTLSTPKRCHMDLWSARLVSMIKTQQWFILSLIHHCIHLSYICTSYPEKWRSNPDITFLFDLRLIILGWLQCWLIVSQHFVCEASWCALCRLLKEKRRD